MRKCVCRREGRGCVSDWTMKFRTFWIRNWNMVFHSKNWVMIFVYTCFSFLGSHWHGLCLKELCRRFSMGQSINYFCESRAKMTPSFLTETWFALLLELNLFRKNMDLYCTGTLLTITWSSAHVEQFLVSEWKMIEIL